MSKTESVITFSEFKVLINSIDEKQFGKAIVYVGADPVVYVALHNGVQAFGQAATPPKVSIQFRKL
jgi:hypothetical protein